MDDQEGHMTKTEKKEILLRYTAIERRIKRLSDEKKRWEEKATSISPSYSAMPKSAGEDKVQSAVCRIIELEQQMDQEIDAQIDLRGIIDAAISGLGDERLQDLMRYRYIDDMKWEEVSDKLCLDCRWVLRLHARALDRLTIESHY